MRTVYDNKLKASLGIDDAGVVRNINQQEYWTGETNNTLEAAMSYVRSVAPAFDLSGSELDHLEEPVSYLTPQPQAAQFRFNDEKQAMDGSTCAFSQTYLNVPVWAAGITTTLKSNPNRIVAATNTSASGMDAKMPDDEAIQRYLRLFATAEKRDPDLSLDKADLAAAQDDALLTRIIGGKANPPGKGAARAAGGDRAALIRGRFYVYQYQAEKRISDEPAPPPIGIAGDNHADGDEHVLCGTPPTLPLPPVPDSIQDRSWHLAAELVFRLPINGQPMNWRALVDVDTDTVLYLRALSSGINGLVFNYDPISSTGVAGNTPNQGNGVLDPLRSDVTLPNLGAPVFGIQRLRGSNVRVTNVESPDVDAPTRPAGNDFDFQSRTNNFAAVNAYFHNDRFFRLVENLGFNRATYFDGTSFPVRIDHRGLGNAINAHCVGDGDGIDHACYALADAGDTGNPIGIATDWRVILHELGGHGILYDHVGSPNFGFAHSAGDSFAMVFNDFASEWHNGAAIDRFVLAPFVPAVARRSDRTVAAGWGWGGGNDVGSYSSEQILSTTMFRFYRSIGGDSTDFGRREFCARATGYLMLRAVGTLTPMSNPGHATGFLSALLTADAMNWTSEGVYGGAYGKVLTWSFEKQNLNGGAVPAVDVYIDDGRGGEYPHQPVHWANGSIWNRRAADGMVGHQEPALGETNYAYVKVRNRGSSVANNVVVRGYHCKPSAGVLWPNDLQPFATPQLAAGTLQPNNIEERIVGPFEWTPTTNAWGHDCMLMIASADGDPSNVDNFTAGEYVEDWRLVPNDNNVGQRNVNPVPGGGGIRGLLAGLHGKGFWIGNPGRRSGVANASVQLPAVLQSRGWKITLAGLPQDGIKLKPHEQRLVTFEVTAGKPFTGADVKEHSDNDIIVTATVDGAVVGGMAYPIDPELKHPYNDRPGDTKGERCREQAKVLLECMHIPADKLACVQVRKVSIDLEMKDDGCGCD